MKHRTISGDEFRREIEAERELERQIAHEVDAADRERRAAGLRGVVEVTDRAAPAEAARPATQGRHAP